jgi:hypothetical protein
MPLTAGTRRGTVNMSRTPTDPNGEAGDGLVTVDVAVQEHATAPAVTVPQTDLLAAYN